MSAQITSGAGSLNAAFMLAFGLFVLVVATWLLWELWVATAPKPLNDEFLRLLSNSFTCDWRNPATWPWTRLCWTYGFALLGVCASVAVRAAIVNTPPSTSTVHVETIGSSTTSR
jgi:hypothetical protein